MKKICYWCGFNLTDPNIRAYYALPCSPGKERNLCPMCAAQFRERTPENRRENPFFRPDMVEEAA